jgi:hypothetical protein
MPVDILTINTAVIEGQKPGTSGLRHEPPSTSALGLGPV